MAESGSRLPQSRDFVGNFAQMRACFWPSPQVDGNGPDYGPALKGFAKAQPPEVVARGIVDPSFDISQGFEGHTVTLKDGKRIDGLILSEGKTVTIRSTGGLTQEVPKGSDQGQEALSQSLMLSANQLGLSAQDIADIVEWMKGY